MDFRPIAIAVSIMIIFTVGYIMGLSHSSSEKGFSGPAQGSAEPYSINAWQQFLTDEGYYHGKIDGYLSDDWRNSKTQKAWDDWYCDKMGISTFELELK